MISHPTLFDILPSDWIMCFRVLPELPPLIPPPSRAIRTDPWFCEVMPNATKSSTLKILCDRLGIGFENVISFGDSGNDADMVSFAILLLFNSVFLVVEMHIPQFLPFKRPTCCC